MFTTLKSSLGILILKYLRFWAKLQLAKRPRATIIGITGSAGKTSTRLALVKILQKRALVKHSVHANSESGIALNILGLTLPNYSLWSWLKVVILAPLRYLTFYENYQYYVVEMGIDSPFPPKNMDYLLSIVKPHIAIVLGASLTHSQAFDSLVSDRDPIRRADKIRSLIAKEKMKLAASLAPSGAAILNCDDRVIMQYAQNLKCRTLKYGRSTQSDLKIIKTSLSSRGFHVQMGYQSQLATLDLTDIFGLEYAHTFAAACAAALALGIPLSKSLAALKTYRSPAGRLRVFNGQNSTHLIDSTYNASPNSVKAALTLLSTVGKKSHKVAVIGDMRELGSVAKAAHQNLSQQLIVNANEAVLFGPNTLKYTVPILQKANFPVRHFSKMSELISYLAQYSKPESWLLFKASQNEIFLERAVEALLANPKDQALLCRRGKYWDEIRRKLT